MILNKGQASTFFWVMAAFFAVFLVIAYLGEAGGESDSEWHRPRSQNRGTWKGKELRFGQGSRRCSDGHDGVHHGDGQRDARQLDSVVSITFLGQMLLNIVFGGKGVGLINLAIFAILGVFLTGLMVGRTPEFLGKKIEAHEVNLVSLALLMHPTHPLWDGNQSWRSRWTVSSIPNRASTV